MLIWHDINLQTNYEPGSMLMSSVTQIEEAIQTVFGAANDLARRTGFVQRVYPGKFDGKSFAATLVLGQIQPGEVSLSQLAHFATHLGVKVTGQGIDERYSQQAAMFLHELLMVSFTQVVAADPVALPLLERFAAVIVEDSSTFSLPDELEEVWRGCGGNRSGTRSAFKWQVRWDLLTGSLRGQALQDGRVPDTRSALGAQPLLKKSVRIVDLGYFDCGQFRKNTTEGSYLFTRFKVSNVKLFDEHGEPLDLLDWVKAHARSAPAQAHVQVSATHRLAARLIAVPVPESVAIKRQADLRRKAQKHSRAVNEELLELAHWTIVITTIPEELLSVSEAMIVLRLRWQIELLFKLFKKEGQVTLSRSQKPWHRLCDLYAKLLGLLMVHWHVIVGCWHIPNRSMVKASQAIRSQIVLLAKALGGKLDLHWVLCEMIEGLEGCRMTKRKKRPSSFQLLMTCSSGKAGSKSASLGGTGCLA
jgi:hypothetical protein